MQLIHYFSKPWDTVFSYFADLQKFGAIHPFIYQVDALSETKFLCHEKMMGIRYAYKVQVIESVPMKRVVLFSNIFGIVQLHLDFQFLSFENRTQLTEIARIKGPPIVKQVFSAILKKAHLNLMERIEME